MKLHSFYCIFKKQFNFEDLMYNKLFNKEKNIKDITIKTTELTKEKKYEIIENNENISLICDKKSNFNIKKEKNQSRVKN